MHVTRTAGGARDKVIQGRLGRVPLLHDWGREFRHYRVDLPSGRYFIAIRLVCRGIDRHPLSIVVVNVVGQCVSLSDLPDHVDFGRIVGERIFGDLVK